MRNREAEALARLLEEGPTVAGEGPAELRGFAALAQALDAVTPRPDDAFKSELRAMLVEEARVLQTHAAPRILPRVRAFTDGALQRWRYSTRMAAASLAAALTFSSGGAVAVAAERALPSDPLYGVKLAIDDMRAAVRLDAVAKGEVYLANSAERIDEAEQSVLLGDQPGAARALRESSDDAREGARQLIRAYQDRGDADLVARLNEFAETQADRVRVLAERLTGEARVAARGSLVVLERIEARLVTLGGLCGDCPAEAPQNGGAIDFSEIPPAEEPFRPCPCDDGSDQDSAPTTPDDDEQEPADEPTTPPSEQPSEPAPPSDDDEGPVQGLPPEADPVTDIVNEILKPIGSKSAEKGLGGIDPSATPSVPESAPTASAPSITPSLLPTGGLGLPLGVPETEFPGL